MSVAAELIKNLKGVLSPAQYLIECGWNPFEWQIKALNPVELLLLTCNRQAGKSTVVSAKTAHKIKYYPNSLVLIITPTQSQSVEVMKKIMWFIGTDPHFPKTVIDNGLAKEFSNGSRILALSGNEKAARGYSDPAVIILDEASRIPDEMFDALTPMTAGGNTEIIMMSTPYGKRGFFYNTYRYDMSCTKMEVVGQDILGEWKNEAEYIAARAAIGVDACYSPRHTKTFLQKELDRPNRPRRVFRQEYCGEFLEADDSVFKMEDILAAMQTEIRPIMDGEDMYSNEVEVLDI